MIGASDLFIAAHARSLGLTLVNDNTREFGQLSKLAIENWTWALTVPIKSTPPIGVIGSREAA